jgi:hypothetical protein
MKDELKKARRIDAELRLKARALRRLKAHSPSVLQDPRVAACTAGKLLRMPTPCSCPMCGNQRKHGKGAARETLAERKARLGEKE